MRTRGVSTPARGDAFEVVAARAGQAPCASTRRPKRATPPPRAPPTKRVATPARRQGSPRESSGDEAPPATVTSAEDGSTGVAEAAAVEVQGQAVEPRDPEVRHARRDRPRAAVADGALSEVEA